MMVLVPCVFSTFSVIRSCQWRIFGNPNFSLVISRILLFMRAELQLRPHFAHLSELTTEGGGLLSVEASVGCLLQS